MKGQDGGTAPPSGANSPKGIKCLGYSGNKYYLMGELDDDVHAYSASELLNRSSLCELRASTDWKAGAKDGKVDWPGEGSALLAACKRAGKFQTKEEKAPRKPKLNGALLEHRAEAFEGWTEQLQRSDKGIKGNDYNVAVALRHAPELAGKIGWDVRMLALVSAQESPAGPAGPWSDSHTARLAIWLQGHDIPVSIRHVETALSAAGRSIQFDPLGDYLNGLDWDGIERIGTWLADYCQADRSDANSIMGSKFLIGAVARALRPGCQMDNMLVLEGDQGKKKSSAIRILGGDYTAENLPDFHSRDAMQIAGGKWIIEVGELAGMGKSQIEAIKAFISRRSDTYVPKYVRHPIDVPRWSVLIGNYNPDGVGILQDTTGGRRFWITAVGDIDIEALARDRDQLWAEAVYCFRRGDAWWPGEDELGPIVAAQEERRDQDDWIAVIEKWVTRDMQGLELDQRREGFTTGEVATDALGFLSRDISRGDQMRIGKCLKQLGYHKIRRRTALSFANVFVTAPSVEPDATHGLPAAEPGPTHGGTDDEPPATHGKPNGADPEAPGPEPVATHVSDSEPEPDLLDGIPD